MQISPQQLASIADAHLGILRIPLGIPTRLLKSFELASTVDRENVTFINENCLNQAC